MKLVKNVTEQELRTLVIFLLISLEDVSKLLASDVSPRLAQSLADSAIEVVTSEYTTN